MALNSVQPSNLIQLHNPKANRNDLLQNFIAYIGSRNVVLRFQSMQLLSNIGCINEIIIAYRNYKTHLEAISEIQLKPKLYHNNTLNTTINKQRHSHYIRR